MTNEDVLDDLVVLLANHCCQLDRTSNAIHAALRTGQPSGLDSKEILDAIAHAAELSARILSTAGDGALDGPAHAVSFTLRAAHEALEALMRAQAPALKPQRARASSPARDRPHHEAAE